MRERENSGSRVGWPMGEEVEEGVVDLLAVLERWDAVVLVKALTAVEWAR